MLHPFRHLYAQQPHAVAYNVGYGTAYCQSQCAHCGVGFGEYGVVVVELVIFLYQLVDIVGYLCRRVGASGFLYRGRELA